MTLTYVLLGTIAVVYPMGWVAVSASGNKNRNLSKAKSAGSRIFSFLIFVVIFIMTAFRHISGISIDEYAYRNRITTYKDMPLSEVMKTRTEWLASVPTWILSNLTQNTQWIIIWCSLITFGILLYCIKKYCDNYEFGILLLFLLNIVNQSFNTMQHVESAAILFLGLPFVYKRKFWKYLIIVGLASLVHSSAILMIALYFIANMKPWSIKFVGVSVAFVIAMVLFNSVSGSLFSSLGVYENYSDTLAAGGGVKIITIIVAFIPICFAFFVRKKLPDDDKMLNTCINVALIYAMIYLVASQQKYVARFALFIQPWLIVLYTKILTYIKNDKLYLPSYYFLTIGYGATLVYFTRQLQYTFMM